jgi:DNA recombination protein RmuC
VNDSLEGELRVKAETQLAEAQTSLEEQRKLPQESKAELKDTFNALSAEALNSNNEAFLALARSTFEGVQAQAKGELQAREKAIAIVSTRLSWKLWLTFQKTQ